LKLSAEPREALEGQVRQVCHCARGVELKEQFNAERENGMTIGFIIDGSSVEASVVMKVERLERDCSIVFKNSPKTSIFQYGAIVMEPEHP
jgi:hypothetical protein